MTTSRLPQYLMGSITLCYLSATTAIICFFAFGTPSTTLAGAFVPVAPTACPQSRPPATRDSFQFVGGTVKSINKQTLQVVPQKPPTGTKPGKKLLTAITNVVYSSTTDITQQTSQTTSALQKGIDVSIEAQLNSNKTYTALSIMVQPNNHGDCSPDRDSKQGSPPHTGKPPDSSTSGGDRRFSPCFAKKQAQKASPTHSCRAEGTIQSLKGNTLTITDRQNTSHTILLTSDTKILQMAPATASALKVGTHIMAMGPTSKETMTASRIMIGTLGSSTE